MRHRHARLLPASAAVLALAACGGTTSAAPTTTVTVDMTTTMARPAGGPAAPASSSSGDTGGSLPALTRFTIPTGPVHRTGTPSAFVSAKGTTQCLVSAQGVSCEPHSGWNNGPAGDKSSPPGYCPDGGQVTGVTVSDKGNAWRCGTPDVAAPEKGTPQAAWAPQDADAATIDGKDLVILPYGESIVVGDYRCLDLESGVECRRLSTQDGFKMTRWGTHWSGSRPGEKSPY